MARKDQVRISETPIHEEGKPSTVIVRVTECINGNIIFEQVASIHKRGELTDTIYRAWAVARTQGFEIVT